MKYIFVTGAPGSKWSSVVNNIYSSNSIDQTDLSEIRNYKHSATGKIKSMHNGAYFDPGMEFGSFFDKLSSYTKEECELEFNRPFTGSGIRIIKSHHFAYHIDFLKNTWPECPLVLVHRQNDACLGWWVRCGHFNISYPKYDFYGDLSTMASHIDNQNKEIEKYMSSGIELFNNVMLCENLKIDIPNGLFQDYLKEDINVRSL